MDRVLDILLCFEKDNYIFQHRKNRGLILNELSNTEIGEKCITITQSGNCSCTFFKKDDVHVSVVDCSLL